MPRTKIAAGIAALLLCTGCAGAGAPGQEREPVRILRDDLMGTMMSITAYAEQEAVHAAYGRIEEIHRVFDRTNKESPVSVLNRERELSLENETAFSDLVNVLALSEWGEGLAENAFSHRLGEIISLWGVGTGGGSIPEPKALEQAMARWAGTAVSVEGSTIRMNEGGGMLDFGSVAKGYACDEAVKALRQCGVDSAILDLGGNVYAMGQKPDGSSWRIGVRSPLGDGQTIGVMTLTDRAAVTSGSYERWFERDGQRYHHIIDPKTGYPAKGGLVSVTILAPEAGVADVMSTICFVLGMERGAELVSEMPELGAIFITGENFVYAVGDTGGFTLTDSRFALMERAA